MQNFKDCLYDIIGHMRKVAKQIFEAIKKADRILIPLHLGPDGDCVGSALAMQRWLKKLGKEVTVVSFDPISEEFGFLEEVEKIKKISVSKLDFSQFDLWLSLDSGGINMITRESDFQLPEGLMSINIDHHQTNTKFAKINLVVADEPSTATIIFSLFKNWGVKIDKKMATRLYLGIYGDTGSFRYDYTKPETLRIGAELLELGANLQLIRNNLEQAKPLELLHYWSLVLGLMKINKKYRFVMAKVSYQDLEKHDLIGVKNSNVVDFAPIVRDTDFGVILTESEVGEVKGSLRARGNFNVAKIAEKMGGGGHKAAAGFKVKGSLEEVERKLLAIIKELT